MPPPPLALKDEGAPRKRDSPILHVSPKQIKWTCHSICLEVLQNEKSV